MLSTFWSWLLYLWSFFKMTPSPTSSQVLEYKPIDRTHDTVRTKVQEIQDLLDAKVSYRVLGRQYGLSKAELKSLQRFNTGRFYFYSETNNVHSNKQLRAERADPVSGQLSSPKGVPLFGSASQAWDWLKRKRIFESFSQDQKQKLANLRASFPNQPLDPTPAGI